MKKEKNLLCYGNYFSFFFFFFYYENATFSLAVILPVIHIFSSSSPSSECITGEPQSLCEHCKAGLQILPKAS